MPTAAANHQNARAMPSRAAAISAAAIVVAAITGCGGAFDATVSGVVTLDDKPVPRGTVSYTPVQGGPAAYAPIEEDGSYEMRTGRERGLPIGEYQVTVTANEPPPVLQTAQGGPPPEGKPITPPWYQLKDSSGLRYNVESGSNEIDLKLTSTPPAGWKAPGSR